jgi:hypothetical protein
MFSGYPVLRLWWEMDNGNVNCRPTPEKCNKSPEFYNLFQQKCYACQGVKSEI